MPQRTFAVASALLLPALLACSGAPDGADDTGREGTTELETARQPVSRLPFLGGAFVTWSGEMPVEVEQAAAGLPTDRPVVVWAGLDAVHSEGAEARTTPAGVAEATSAPLPR